MVSLDEGMRLEDFGIDGRIHQRKYSGNEDEGGELDSSGAGWGPVAGCCQHGSEHFGSTEGEEFMYVTWCQLLEEEVPDCGQKMESVYLDWSACADVHIPCS
jgi:hypothetical protein